MLAIFIKSQCEYNDVKSASHCISYHRPLACLFNSITSIFVETTGDSPTKGQQYVKFSMSIRHHGVNAGLIFPDVSTSFQCYFDLQEDNELISTECRATQPPFEPTDSTFDACE